MDTTTQTNAAKHPLVDYIESSQSAGLTNQQIIDALTNEGWRTREVLEIVLDHRAATPTIPQVPAAPGSSGTSGSDADKEQSRKATQTENIISVNDISMNYGKFQALDKVSLNVRRGSITALLGPNGAGKTTLVKILTTLLKPTGGKAEVAGFDVVHQTNELRSTIGLSGQYAAVDPILTGRENLEMVGRLYHLSKSEAKARAAELLNQFNLNDAGDRAAKTYSGGMRRRLDLAASLIIKPKVLFLDEPTTGLDPRSRFVMWDVIRQLVAGGTTLLLTTQYLEEADQLADYIFVIDHGHIIANGTPNELKSQVGGDVLELHMTNKPDAARAAQIVAPFGDAEPQADQGTGIVTMPTDRGAGMLVEVVRRLAEADIHLSDVLLRRPSLDDVFMKLTGHTAEEENK